jgi:PIN domain nuclease of toxin-antitoxin system
MKILLDTCAFLWIISDAPELTDNARMVFHNPENEIYLSAVSAWEIMVKHSAGKLPLPSEPMSFIREQRKQHEIKPLSLDESSVSHLAELPGIHRDPFDRMSNFTEKEK